MRLRVAVSTKTVNCRHAISTAEGKWCYHTGQNYKSVILLYKIVEKQGGNIHLSFTEQFSVESIGDVYADIIVISSNNSDYKIYC